MHDGGMNPFSEDICNALDSQIIDIEIQLEENGIVYPYVWVMNNIMPIKSLSQELGDSD